MPLLPLHLISFLIQLLAPIFSSMPSLVLVALLSTFTSMLQFHLLVFSFKQQPILAALPPSSSILPAINLASIQLSIMLLQWVAIFLVDLFTVLITIEQQVMVATIELSQFHQLLQEFLHLALHSVFKHQRPTIEEALDHQRRLPRVQQVVALVMQIPLLFKLLDFAAAVIITKELGQKAKLLQARHQS